MESTLEERAVTKLKYAVAGPSSAKVDLGNFERDSYKNNYGQIAAWMISASKEKKYNYNSKSCDSNCHCPT